ncbi:hypothetical protein ABI59_04840 [Acidobacteria bacterium Mor1]|nr:hypothetical protein ABI59_04840 [Acidobacteria bacterium Mor1]
MEFRLQRPLFLCLLLVLAAAGVSAAEGELSLSEGDRGARIYVPRRATPAERTAARELSRHLVRATDARFAVRRERRNPPAEPGIYVGDTGVARSNGIDPQGLGPESWVIRRVPEGLVLTGGSPRGTLYAVFHFLEDHVGVRWWNRYVTDVPRHARLTVGELDESGTPAFPYRDIHGEQGAGLFFARNRINGHYGEAAEVYGGAERYGPPFMVHTFALYLPPDEHFDEHPEYYSEIGGVRVAEGQLCLTDEGLYQAMEARLRDYIEQGERRARRQRRKPPELYHVGPNDWGRSCACAACRKVIAETGSESGLLLRFVNRLAAAIRHDHPDVRLDTLAYYYTLKPPRNERPADDLVVRLSGLQWRDFSRSIEDPRNQKYREFFEAWSAITRRLRIWDYSVTFGPAGDLPLSNLGPLAADFRYFLDRGVEGIFIQHAHPVTSDMRDLKLWVLTRLMQDPGQDVQALIEEFAHGFYGPAAGPILEYLAGLDQASAEAECRIRTHAAAPQYCYLDLDFVSRAHALFDRAEQAVAGDDGLRARVQHARISLDRATLQIWPGLVAERSVSGAGAAAPLPSLDTIANRMRETWYRESRRFPAPRFEAEREAMELDLARWLDRAARAEARAAREAENASAARGGSHPHVP